MRLGKRLPPPSAGWRRSQFVLASPGPAAVHVVEAARLTRFQTGRLRTTGRPDRWISGAVHDANRRLMPASQRMRGHSGDFVVAADPANGPRKESEARLSGTWLYGGNWMRPFGHFITETLTTLWSPSDAVAGLVFHRWISPDPTVAAWQQELVDRAGHAGLPIVVVDRSPVDVERLLVPDRTFVVGGWVDPQAVAVWRRVGGSVVGADAAERVYLSRTDFNAKARAEGRAMRSSPERDAELDEDFAAAGFAVVHPEQLPIGEQVALVSRAGVIAGAAGSGLHLAAFAVRPTRVIEVGDSRSPRKRLTGQRLIDAACGHVSALVPGQARARDVLERLDLEVDPASVAVRGRGPKT